MNLSALAASLVSIWSGLPPHVQTPLIQACGAIMAALLALAGVMITLRWNRKKHLEDREMTLKKDVFVTFIRMVASTASSWLDMINEPIANTAGASEAQASVRPVANRASREAADAVIAMMNEITNRARAARLELKAHRALLDKERANIIPRPLSEVSEAAFFDHQRKLVDGMVEKIGEFGAVFNNAVQEFRRELGLSRDAEWFDSREKMTVESFRTNRTN